MKTHSLFTKSILLLIASTTLAFAWQNQSISVEIEPILPNPNDSYSFLGVEIPEIPCGLNPFCRQPTKWANGTNPPTPPPPENPDNFHYYRSITFENQTKRTVKIQAQFNVDNHWQRIPSEKTVIVLKPGEKYSPIVIDVKKKANKITDKNFLLLVYDENGKFWNNTLLWFFSVDDGGKAEYFKTTLNDEKDFIYKITQQSISLPWIFPILP